MARASLWPIPFGGSLAGDALLQTQGETPEQIATHPHPFYTPIATVGSNYVLEASRGWAQTEETSHSPQHIDLTAS
jgi:hypothetical protein